MKFTLYPRWLMLVPPGENAWRAPASTFLERNAPEWQLFLLSWVEYIGVYKMGLYGIIWDIISANLFRDIDTYSIPTLYILYVYCSRSALLELHICIIYIIWVHDEYNMFYL